MKIFGLVIMRQASLDLHIENAVEIGQLCRRIEARLRGEDPQRPRARRRLRLVQPDPVTAA